jgi:hypothetical protein
MVCLLLAVKQHSNALSLDTAIEEHVTTQETIDAGRAGFVILGPRCKARGGPHVVHHVRYILRSDTTSYDRACITLWNSAASLIVRGRYRLVPQPDSRGQLGHFMVREPRRKREGVGDKASLGERSREGARLPESVPVVLGISFQ